MAEEYGDIKVLGTLEVVGVTTLSTVHITTSANITLLTVSTISITNPVTLPNNSVATTQAADDNSTKLATTAYVDTGLGTKAGIKTHGQTEITAIKSTTNTSYEDVNGLSVTITTTGGDVLVIMSSNAVWANGAAIEYFKAVLDNTTSSGESFCRDVGALENSTVGHFSWLFTSVSSGSHTFKIQWKTTTATAKLNTRDGTNPIGSTRIIAIEL
jgi:hypothetical protein